MRSREYWRALALFALAATGLTAGWGCNTVEGAGEDIESVGEEIDEEAEEHD